MKKVFRIIISLFLLVAFLTPSIVKIEHHHEHHICNAKSQKHLHVYHDSCKVCNFEFSVFSSNLLNIKLEKEKHLANYSNNYSFQFNSTHSDYSFLLRGPPVFTNII